MGLSKPQKHGANSNPNNHGKDTSPVSTHWEFDCFPRLFCRPVNIHDNPARWGLEDCIVSTKDWFSVHLFLESMFMYQRVNINNHRHSMCFSLSMFNCQCILVVLEQTGFVHKYVVRRVKAPSLVTFQVGEILDLLLLKSSIFP